MSSNITNFKKPCKVCRHRKVKCDKAQPCKICIRHQVACVYEDPPRESAISQQQLVQDRVDRLECMIEDPVACSLSNLGSSCYENSSSSANSPLSNLDDYSDVSVNAGNQVFVYNNPCHKGADSWMNIIRLDPGQQHRPKLFSQTRPGESLAQPRAISKLQHQQQQPKSLRWFYLPYHKEDVIMGLFFDHIEPWIGVNYQPYFWELVGDFCYNLPFLYWESYSSIDPAQPYD
ncbi:hypothetical protein BGZ63DRAFT_458507 [Mariannaea sp. PMI_226]|nr:hypothetical protein BGZ63DRAFT_458507 [Mariannaea sp. PMI_226]